MPYIIDDCYLVCAECSEAYDEFESRIEYSHPQYYPDGYTCDDCWTVCSRADKEKYRGSV
jgi:hypothetical protein